MNINYGGSLNGLLLHLPACHKPLSQKRQKSWVLLYWSPVNYFSKGCQRVKWGTLSDVSCQRSYFSDLTGLWWVCVCGSSVWVAVLEQRLMVKGWWLKAVCAWHENVKHGRLREGNQQGLSGLFFPFLLFDTLKLLKNPVLAKVNSIS